MKNVWAVLVLVLTLVGVSGCSTTERTTTGNREITVATTTETAFTMQTVNGVAWAIPQGMDIDKYQILPGRKNRRLTEAQVISMGLRLDTAPAGTVLWNEDSQRHAFWLDTLRKERAVWRNEANEIVYIADCGNRAMEPKVVQVCPLNVTCPGPHVAAVSSTDNPGANGANGSSGDGSWIPGWVRSVFGLLDDLLWLLLLLIALIVAAILLTAVARALADQFRGRQALQPQPAPAPMAPVRPRHWGPRPAAVAAAPAVAPQPEATFQRFGPYDHIAIDDAGAEGYRVIGFTGNEEFPLGTFRWAQTENAGDRGEYVVVMI